MESCYFAVTAMPWPCYAARLVTDGARGGRGKWPGSRGGGLGEGEGGEEGGYMLCRMLFCFV